MKILDTDNVYATLLVFVAVGIIVLIPLNISFISPFTQAFADFEISDLVFSRLRSERASTSDTNIVIVNIGHLPRNLIAKQIERIAREEPAAIGIDAFFRQPKTRELDSPLVAALARAKNLVLVSKVVRKSASSVEFDSIETSHPMFNRFARNGFANVIVDSTAGFRTVRTFSPRERVNDTNRLSFSLALTQTLNPKAVERFLARGNDMETVNYRGNYSRFYVLDVADVLDTTVDIRFLRGKIVLMGFMGFTLNDGSVEDTFFTPINERSAGKSLPDMYGIVIHANIISMILHESYINTMPAALSIFIAALVCYANMVLFHYLIEHYDRLYQPLSIVVQLTEWIVLVWLLVYLLDKWSYKADFTLALTVCAFSAGIFEIYSASVKPVLQTFQEWFLRRRLQKAV